MCGDTPITLFVPHMRWYIKQPNAIPMETIVRAIYKLGGVTVELNTKSQQISQSLHISKKQMIRMQECQEDHLPQIAIPQSRDEEESKLYAMTWPNNLIE
jgi:hypothetical protein